MNTLRLKPVTAAMLCAAALSAPALMAARPASAAAPTDSVVAASTKPGADASALMKLSQEGFQAMRAIRGARVAIFNGDPKLAGTLVAQAKTDLDKASSQAPTFVVNSKIGIDGKIVRDDTDAGKLNLIPIDGQLSLADSFVPTPDKQAHIGKANEHFQAGRAKEGIDELRLAEVDVNYTRVLMPLDATQKRVADASALIADNKYYEANLALKAAEDGVVTDAVSLVATPEKAGRKAAAKASRPAK